MRDSSIDQGPNGHPVISAPGMSFVSNGSSPTPESRAIRRPNSRRLSAEQPGHTPSIVASFASRATYPPGETHRPDHQLRGPGGRLTAHPQGRGFALRGDPRKKLGWQGSSRHRHQNRRRIRASRREGCREARGSPIRCLGAGRLASRETTSSVPTSVNGRLNPCPWFPPGKKFRRSCGKLATFPGPNNRR